MSFSFRSPPSYYPQDIPEDVENSSSNDEDYRTYSTSRGPPTSSGTPSFSNPPDYSSSRRHAVLGAANRRRYRPPKDHRFSYYDASQHPWAHLRIKSPPLKSKSPLPTYRPGDEVIGSIDLDLRKEKMIMGIEVSIRGKIVPRVTPNMQPSIGPVIPETAYEEEFLKLSTTLWKPSMGDPRSSYFSSLSTSTEPAPQLTSRKAKRMSLVPPPREYKDKMMGVYTFPFKFIIPQATMSASAGRMAPLPPSIDDETSPVCVVYEITLSIQTALFKSDATLTANLMIIPHNRPPPPSPSREFAYTCRSPRPPPGPLSDPQGWTVLPSSNYYGLFRGERVMIKCAMAVANPLLYTRGYTIPIQLLLTPKAGNSASQQALTHILQATGRPLQVRIALQRKLSYYCPLNRKQKSVQQALTLAMAVCWCGPGSSSVPDSRVVECEIKVRKDTIPTFDFGDLKALHSVSLLPFLTSSLTPAQSPHNLPLLEVPVEIVTALSSRDFEPMSFAPYGAQEPPLATVDSC